MTRMMGLACAILLSMTSVIAAHGSVTKKPFGTMPDGTHVELFTLKNPNFEVDITNYGARVVAVKTPDRNGTLAGVVLGYDTLAEYLDDPTTYYGAIVGRYGNRVAKGQFTIDGHQYQIPVNDNGQALHGGPHGFDKMVWTAKEIPNGVEMTLVSKDGDMGFPGTLTAHVQYTIVASSLHIHYIATTDKATVVNLTNHTYFNLAGEGSGTILGQEMMLASDKFTPVDSVLIPTGVLQPVEGTPFDFRKSTVIGQRIADANEQLKLGGGYDHNWVISTGAAGGTGTMKMAARGYDPASGRTLTVTTTQPGVQFYSGNFMTGKHKGHDGHDYPRRSGFCLETQHYPDSPNHPAFPSTLLKPGQTMESTTVFAFSVSPK